MSSEDESLAKNDSQQPSTSSAAQRLRRSNRTRRTELTPSPFSTDLEDEAEPQEISRRSRLKKGSKKTTRATSPIEVRNCHSGKSSQERVLQPSKKPVRENNSGTRTRPTRAVTTSRKRSYSNDTVDNEADRRSKKNKTVERENVTPYSDTDEDVSPENRKKRKSPPSNSQKTRPNRKQKVTPLDSRIRAASPISSICSQSLFNKGPLTSHPGVIKSLQLTNFMCHSNFTHNFHPNLNFITGQNGSGKSALLSGILIALGGKATVTSRTTSLKALVQKGKHTARVAVTLLNKNGLRRYGDEITIERWVNINGSGGYRIKSVGGEDEDCVFTFRALKRPELDRILMGLNIQIDNPVAVLNQEVARSFLRSKDPKVKFRLFYEGTLLSKLETVIGETKDTLQETNEILQQKRQMIDAVKQEVVQLKQKVEKISELHYIREKLEIVRYEYLWSVVIDQEKSVEKTKKSIANVEKEIGILIQSLDKMNEEYSRLNEQSIVREQSQVRDKLAEKQREFDRVRGKLAEIRRNYSQIKGKLRTLISTVATKEAQANKLSASIEKVKGEQDAKSREESNLNAAKLDQLQADKKQYESSIVAIKLDADNFHQAVEQEREKLQQIDNEARRIKTQIENKKRHIVALNSRTRNRYAGFGPQMEQLMTKIEANRHRFRLPPKGPLGACFTIKDQTYAPIIESILQKHLRAFVVGHPDDLHVLKRIIDEVYGARSASQRRPSGPPPTMPGIISMRYAPQMYDIARFHAAHPNAPSILQLIEVENNDHLVMNALIDIAEIEKQIIFKDNLSASSILKNKETTPKSLKLAYTLQWYKFTPAPHYAARVMPIRKSAEILKSGRNRESEIDALKLEIQALEEELKGLEPGKVAIRSTEQCLRSTYDEKNDELTRMRRKLGEISNEIKRHATKMKEKEKRCDLTSYYEELEELKEDLQNAITSRDAANRELEPMQPELNALEDEKTRLDDEVKVLSTRMNSFDEDRDKLKSKRARVENVIKRSQDKLNSLESTKSGHTRELDAKQADLAGKLKSAAKVCPGRVETKRTPSDIQNEFEGIKVRIQETEARLGDENELKAEYKKREKKFHSLKNEYFPLKKMHKMATETNTEQHDSFETLKLQMGRTLTMFFQSMAKQRGYEGRLLADFSTKELYYFVCPDGDSSSKTVKALDAQGRGGPLTTEQMKQNKQLKKSLIEYSLGLSGGERSFATICFIMAIWQVMECPFYMLDEFDVFMDAFNRKTSQIALMAHAKKFSQNQFVLFTPLDLGDVPGADEACVLRLFPPVRGANSNGPQNGGNDVSPPDQEAGTSNQGRSTGLRNRAGESPNDSAENIDPLGSGTSQGKGNVKQRRQGRRDVVMGEI